VVVAVPWRPTPDRLTAFMYVRDWYAEQFPDWIFGTADSGAEQFNRAASRNACVRMAENACADVVVLNDADTIPVKGAVAAAVYGAADDGRLHFGLDTMLYLTPEEQEAWERGEQPTREALPHDSSVIAIRPASYWQAGGQDERFTGYGGEDGAFTSACTAILGPPVWHQGMALSLYHDPSVRDIGSERWKPNSALAKRYGQARNNINRMRRILAEPGRHG
jgi:hypothetical protein